MLCTRDAQLCWNIVCTSPMIGLGLSTSARRNLLSANRSSRRQPAMQSAVARTAAASRSLAASCAAPPSADSMEIRLRARTRLRGQPAAFCHRRTARAPGCRGPSSATMRSPPRPMTCLPAHKSNGVSLAVRYEKSALCAQCVESSGMRVYTQPTAAQRVPVARRGAPGEGAREDGASGRGAPAGWRARQRELAAVRVAGLQQHHARRQQAQAVQADDRVQYVAPAGPQAVAVPVRVGQGWA